jgi:hypothetical protein
MIMVAGPSGYPSGYQIVGIFRAFWTHGMVVEYAKCSKVFEIMHRGRETSGNCGQAMSARVSVTGLLPFLVWNARDVWLCFGIVASNTGVQREISW